MCANFQSKWWTTFNFWPKNFWSKYCWGCLRELGGGWNELGGAWNEPGGGGWSWLEVDGAEWRWVHGLVIPNKQYHFLKVRNKTFSDAYMLIALVDLDFLLLSAQNCKKCTFLDNLRTIAQERNMETRQMTPLVSSTSSALFVTFIF